MDSKDWIRLHTFEDILDSAHCLRDQLISHMEKHNIKRPDIEESLGELLELIEELSPEYDDHA